MPSRNTASDIRLAVERPRSAQIPPEKSLSWALCDFWRTFPYILLCILSRATNPDYSAFSASFARQDNDLVQRWSTAADFRRFVIFPKIDGRQL